MARIGGLAVDVTGARTQVPELAGAHQPDLILLNDDNAGYVLVRFDPRSLRTVLQAVGELPSTPARAVCWNTVIDMTRQGELPVPAFAAMLARGMATEPSVPVLHAVRTDQEWQAVVFDEKIVRPAAADLAARLGLAGARLRRYPGGSRPVYAVGDRRVLKLYPTVSAPDSVTEARVLEYLQRQAARRHARAPGPRRVRERLAVRTYVAAPRHRAGHGLAYDPATAPGPGGQ